MRIARILTRLNLGGPARQALAADPLLAERGHEVRVLTGQPEHGEGDLFETFRDRGIDVVRVPGLRRRISPLRDRLARRAIRRELARFAPDVVHTHASKAGALGRRAVLDLADAGRVGRVHTFHGHVLEGYFPTMISRLLVIHERRLAARTDRVLAVSHATGDDLLRLGVTDEAKLVIVPPGVALDGLLEIERPPPGSDARAPGALRRLVGAESRTVLVGVVGRLAEVKRPARALDVFERLCGEHPDLHLVFVGDGTERGLLERRIRALGELGEERVHLVGAIEDMQTVLADLDLVLLTSRSEGLPVALIEAGAAALPAVAADVGGVGEVIEHERTGLLGASTEDLTRALARLLDDPEERARMGERARLRVGHRYSAPALAGRLEDVYTTVREERSREGAA